jgi:voltage-gated potassium channel Kch
VLFGLLAWPLVVEDSSAEGLRAGVARVAELAVVGIFVGLAALVPIAVLAVVGLLAARTLARYWPAARRFDWAASLVLATLSWIGFAADAASRWPQVAHLDRPLWLVAAGAVVAGLSILGRAALRTRGTLGPGRRA